MSDALYRPAATAAQPKTLSPELYRKLKEQFKDVQIANPGSTAYRFPAMYVGDKPTWKGGEYLRVNCFAGETLVATQLGDVAIRSLVGKSRLLIPNKKGTGYWKDVSVRCFGKQPLLTLTLRRGRTVKKVRVTPGHRWLVSGRLGLYRESTTLELKPGEVLANCHAKNIFKYGVGRCRLSTIGVAQGFIFGDGSREKKGCKPAYVTICTDTKNEAILPFFAGCRITNVNASGRLAKSVRDLPRTWKELPDREESLSFLGGWLAGYFAADGTVNKAGTQAVLYSKLANNLEFAKGILYEMGVQVSPVKPKHRRNAGCVPGSVGELMYSLSFAIRDLPLDFWLLQHHQQRVASRTGREVRMRWTVESVEDFGEIDEVYCAVVPGVEAFTLSDNLLTKNCPFCNDDRRRLWISYMYGQLDDSNRLLTNVAHCFNEQCLEVSENAERLKDALLGFQNYSTRKKAVFQLSDSEWSDEPAVTMTPIMPEGVIPFEQLVSLYPQHPAVAYMLGERRYTMEQLDHYEVGYCISSSKFPEASNRIIFPLVMHERLMGWQARFVGKPDSKRVNKYYGMPGMQKQFILYNFDKAVGKPFTVLFEGVTDVHRLGDYAMAVLGKTLSPVHRSLLAQSFENKPIFVGLDPDAEDYGGRAVAELRSMNLRAYPLTFPNNLDPADMEQEALIGLIRYQAKQVGEQI